MVAVSSDVTAGIVVVHGVIVIIIDMVGLCRGVEHILVLMGVPVVGVKIDGAVVGMMKIPVFRGCRTVRMVMCRPPL